MNDFQIGLVASLDGTKSKQQLNADIDALKRQLGNVEIQAKLGKDVVTNLTKQLNATQISLQNVNIDQNTINKMVDQINNALSGININLGQNIGNNLTNNLSQQARQAGQIVSQEVESSLKNITSKEIGLHFEVEKTDSDEFNKAVDDEILKLQKAQNTLKKVRYTTNTELVTSEDIFGNKNYEQVEKLTGAIFSYNTQAGEAINKTMKWAQIGIIQNDKGEDIPLMGWVQGLTTYTKALDEATVKTDTFIDKQKTAVNKAEIALAKINQNLNDTGASKTLANTDFNANGLNARITKVNDAIEKLRNSNKTTFTEAKNNVDKEIASLENLITKLKNAEYAATSLRTKDIKTIRSDEGNKLDAFIEKMKQSGHYTSELEGEAKNLKSTISNILDTNSLTTYLNGVSNLKSKFEKINAEEKTKEKDSIFQSNKSSLESKISNLSNKYSDIDTFETKINGAVVTVKTLNDELENAKSKGDLSVITAKFNAFEDAAKAAGRAVKELSTNTISVKDITDSISKTGDTTTAITTLQNNFAKLGLTSEEVAGRMSFVNSELTKLNELMNSKASDDKIVEQFNKLNVALSQTQNDLRQTRSEISTTNVIQRQFATNTSRLSKAESWRKWLENNSKATKKYGKEIEELIEKMGNLNTAMTKTEANNLNSRMLNIQSDARKAGLLGMSFSDKLKNAWEKFGGWSLATGSLMQGVSKVKDAVSEIKNVDDIITEISKTSDLTERQLKTLGITSYDKASKFGKTATNYLTGVQEMYRAGFSNAEQMSELSILAQAAGDMTSDVANDYLIATSAAYDYQGSVEKLNEVLDGQNYITNNAAVAMDDMAAATSEAASIASQYGVKVEELSSLIAVATSKTRESGSETGNALKSIFINLQDTTNKQIVKAFDDVGISMTKIVDGAEQLKTPIELLKELSDAFTSLPQGDTRRANILSDIGGKYRANTLSAILSDWSSYEKMLDLYSQGSGSALGEAEKNANNLSGSINKLDNSWTEFINHLVQSDDLKNIVNIGNDIIQVIDVITSKLGLFGTLLPSIGIGAFVKNFSWLTKSYKDSPKFLVG